MEELEVLKQKFHRLVELRQKRDKFETAKKNAEKEYRNYEAELWAEVEDSPLSGQIKFDFGGKLGEIAFQAKETIYGRILDEDVALDAFNKEAITDELTGPKIEKARLHELVRERMENGQPLPDGVDWKPRRYISISGQDENKVDKADTLEI